MLSVNEEAANHFYTPGGYTAKGQMEAVIDPIPESMYSFKPVK